MAEALSIVTDYGSDLIDNHNIFDKRPPLSFSGPEIEEVFAHLKDDSSEEFVAGFTSCFCDYIASKWLELSAEQKASIQSHVLIILKLKFGLNYALRFSVFVAKVYKLCNYVWPELLAIIFDSMEFSDLLGFVFINSFNVFTDDYISSNKQKIVDRMFQFFSHVSLSTELRLMNVLCSIENISLTPEQIAVLWDNIFDIIIKNPDTLIVINTILTGIFGEYANIQKLKKPTIDSNEKLEASLRLLFVFNPEQTIEIIDCYMTKQGTDKKLINALNSDFLDTVQANQLNSIAEYLIADAETKIARFAACAPLLPFICNQDKGYSSKAIEVLRAASETDLFAFCQILQYSSSCIFAGPRLPFVTATLLKLLENDDELGKLAAVSIKFALKNGLIKTRPDMKSIISKFGNIAVPHHSNFILAMDALVNVESFDAYLITPLVEFVRNQLRISTLPENVISACFTLVSSLAERDENAPFSMQKELINLIPKLIDGENSSKPAAAHILYLFVEMQPECVRKILPIMIEKLFAFALSSCPCTEYRGAVGESLAGIIASYDNKKLYPQLAELIEIFLKNGERNLGVSGSTMVIIACDVFEGELAQSVFLSCARAAASTDYAPLFNSFVEGMRRLSSKVKIGQSSIDFALEVISGFVKVTELEPISAWYNLRTPIYAFFTIIIDTLKEQALPLIPYLVDILSDCVDPMVDVVFEPIHHIFQLPFVGDDAKNEIVQIAAKRCISAKSIPLLDFSVSNITDFTVLKEKLIPAFKVTDDDDDEWKSSIGLALLQIQAKGIEIDEDSLEEAILDFPPDSKLNKSSLLAQEIVRISGNETTPDRLKIVSAKVIFDFLLLPKQDASIHNITNSLLNQLKETMKSIIKSNKDIEKEIIKYCGGVRAKINKLNNLTK